MFMLLLGRMPATSDRVEWDGWMFEVVDMDSKRIDKVLATPVEKPEESDSETALPWSDGESCGAGKQR
jgi:putative hemolysin